MEKGKLYIISGPSGAGKGTVIKELFKQRDGLFLSVSATTRAARQGEADGVHYYFITKDEFRQMIIKNELLEYTEFCENYYGTPKKSVEEKLNAGVDVILEIETDGAMQIKGKMPECVLIFISPPSMEELEKRLVGRQTETNESLNKRLKKAKKEIELTDKYHYIVINDEVDKTVKALIEIFNKKGRR